MKRLSIAWGLLLLLWQPLRAGQLPLVELVRPGPWAGISGLQFYGNRLYLVNSEIFVDHNAADIYSYHPGERSLRFEHRLFSQDAGAPAIIDGFLYWPYEDARFSTTLGEFAMTDGRTWQWRVAPDLRGYHVHAMLAHQNLLYALVSGWRGRVYRSQDRGERWELFYEYPSPEGQVSRITALLAHGDTLYYALTAWAEESVKLLRQDGHTIRPVSGWPVGRSLKTLRLFRDRVYGVNVTDDGSRVWRTDGHSPAQPITALDGYAVQALVATEQALWAVSGGGEGGILWRSTDGISWERLQTFPAMAVDVHVVGEQVFVGTYHANGGALWGPRSPSSSMPLSTPPLLTPPPPRLLAAPTLTRALSALDAALQDVPNPEYRTNLLTALLPLALSRDPAAGQALAQRLSQNFPTSPVALFGGNVLIPASRLAQWYLFYAIAINGYGTVPPPYLTIPWNAPANPPEKYLEPAVAAAWAVLQLRQDDPMTLAALRAALHGSIPGWAQGDFLVALHALAGQPFQYLSGTNDPQKQP